MSVNPNPQTWSFAAFEAPRLKVTMSPAEDITGQTFSLNIRDRFGTLLLAVTAFTVVTLSTGVFYFDLSTADTGTTLGPGAYTYDVWRTNSGNEKRLVYGPLPLLKEQWH